MITLLFESVQVLAFCVLASIIIVVLTVVRLTLVYFDPDWLGKRSSTKRNALANSHVRYNEPGEYTTHGYRETLHEAPQCRHRQPMQEPPYIHAAEGKQNIPTTSSVFAAMCSIVSNNPVKQHEEIVEPEESFYVTPVLPVRVDQSTSFPTPERVDKDVTPFIDGLKPVVAERSQVDQPTLAVGSEESDTDDQSYEGPKITQQDHPGKKSVVQTLKKHAEKKEIKENEIISPKYNAGNVSPEQDKEDAPFESIVNNSLSSMHDFHTAACHLEGCIRKDKDIKDKELNVLSPSRLTSSCFDNSNAFTGLRERQKKMEAVSKVSTSIKNGSPTCLARPALATTMTPSGVQLDTFNQVTVFSKVNVSGNKVESESNKVTPTPVLQKPGKSILASKPKQKKDNYDQASGDTNNTSDSCSDARVSKHSSTQMSNIKRQGTMSITESSKTVSKLKKKPKAKKRSLSRGRDKSKSSRSESLSAKAKPHVEEPNLVSVGKEVKSRRSLSRGKKDKPVRKCSKKRPKVKQ